MKQQLIQATRVAVNSTTKDYGNTFRSIARSIGRYLAVLFAAGLVTGEYVKRYWQSFERWSAGWSGDPFVVEPEPVMAVAAPAKPPVKPPAPPKTVRKTRKRSAKNAHRTTPAGFAA